MKNRAVKIIASTKWLPLLLLLLLLVLPAVAQAQFNYTVSNGAATITGYTGSGGAVAIPGTIDGYPVTGIASDAFQFSSATSISIPASVTNIEEEAFDGCFGLTAITVDGSNPAYSNVGIGGVLFDKAQDTLVQYPDGLAGGYIIPNSVTNIIDGAFNNCLFLTSVNIQASVLNIGNNFINCPSLTGFVVGVFNPNYSSDFGVLMDQAQATVVRFPGNRNGIYTVPAGVTSIATNAFEDSFLDVVLMPASLNSIGEGAFSGCANLTSVYFQGNAPMQNNDSTVFYGDNIGTVYYLPGTTGWGAMLDGWPTILATNPPNYGYFTWRTNTAYNASQITITGYTGPGGAVAIPNTINGDPVAYIQNAAFSGLSGLTSVIIPDSVVTIGYEAFYDCYGLTNVTIGNSVTSIGDDAFYDCYRLPSIDIPGSVASIGNQAFLYCQSITNVIIGDGVTSIGNSAFEDCFGNSYYILSSVNIPASVTSIGEWAFLGCENLTAINVDPANPVYSSLNGVLFDEAQATLLQCPGALAGVWPETGGYAIPGTVTTIGTNAFDGCYRLGSVYIPESVTNIEDWAFSSCILTNVIIPASVAHIGSYAFADNSGLSAVYFEKNPPTPNNDSTVFVNDANPIIYYQPVAIGWNTTFDGRPTALLNLAVDFDYYMTYNPNIAITISGYIGPAGAMIIPSTINGYPVTTIDNNAFLNNSSITSFSVMGTNLTSIGNSAFYYCSSLTSANIPGSVTSIGDDAFFSCDSLSILTMGDGVTSIGQYAIDGTELSSIVIPASVTNITDLAFWDNQFLTSITVDPSNPDYSSLNGVLFDKAQTTLLQFPIALNGPYTLGSYTIPDSVTTIGDYAFGLSFLTSVDIPASVTNIGSYAFNGCYYLTTITIPDSVISIGDGAFSGANLTSVTIPDGVASIGNGAFAACYELTSVTIPASVTNIGDGFENEAFAYDPYLTNITVDASNLDYSSLSGVLFDKAQETLLHFPGGLAGSYTIPTGVTSIGQEAFESCYRLASVALPDTVTSIGPDAFYQCSGLTNVTLGSGVTNIGSYAFYYCGGLPRITIPASVTAIGSGAFNSCLGLTSVTFGTGVTNIGGYAFYDCPSLKGVYFQGNSPTPTNDLTVFSGDSHGVVYYLPDTTGWGSLFDGLPTAMWLPQMQAGNSSLGVQSSQFGFNISWAGDRVVVVEAATNLADPVWIPVSTNTLVNGASSFSDPLWTNYPGRYYRLSSQ